MAKNNQDKEEISSRLHDKLLLSSNSTSNENQKNPQLSFLDDGPISISKLPKQIADLIWISVPNAVSFLGIFYYNFMNMFFSRKIGNNLSVAAFGMGATWYATSTLCLQVSISNGLFIQLAHAFGAKNFKRCQGILCALGIISSILLWNTKNILIWMGINYDIADLTEDFSIYCIPSIFGSILYDTLKQVLMSQKIFDIPMKIQLLVYLIHPLWCYLFTSIFPIGLKGIGLSRSISEWLGFILLSLLVQKKNLILESWNFKYSMKIILSQWGPFLKIAAPVGAIVLLGWVFFEIQTIIIGKLKDDNLLAGQVAFQSLVMFFVMTPLGISYTINSYLGNAVGEGKLLLCKQFTKISMITQGVLCIFFILIGELMKGIFYDIFCVNQEMGEYFLLAYNFYLYGYLSTDFFVMMLSGVLKCCDQQNFGSLCYFIIDYLLGIPMILYLTFTLDLKQKGVYITQTVVTALIALIFLYQVIKIDWNKAINNIQLRVKKENEDLEQEMNELGSTKI